MNTATASEQRDLTSFEKVRPTKHQAWVASAAKQPMKPEVVDLGPFGADFRVPTLVGERLPSIVQFSNPI